MTDAEIYHALRTFSTTWGQVFMMVSFLVLCAWPFRPGARPTNEAAARMIFEDENDV